jgi:TPR repeat protein
MARLSQPPRTVTLRRSSKIEVSLLLALLLACTAVVGGQYEDAYAAKARGDFPTAFASFKRLALNGDAGSQFELSLMYSAGKGVKPDAKHAFHWLRQAAAHGNVQAQSNLGVALNRGLAVPQDSVKALVWLSIAAASGDTTAITNRDVAARRLSVKQVEQAKALAQECKQRMAEVLRLPQCL